VLRTTRAFAKGEEAALLPQGQQGSGANHGIVAQDSLIQGGGRTIFVLGNFAPSEQWNHHLTFWNNRITCGSHKCFQISGGGDEARRVLKSTLLRSQRSFRIAMWVMPASSNGAPNGTYPSFS
jgi:hypothetical protein